MKKLITIAILISVTVIGARAQDLTTNGFVTQVYNLIETSGVLSSTNYSIDPYFTYAPHAPNGDKFGGGTLVTYNVNNYAGLSIGGDYLGQFSLVSGSVTFKVPIRLDQYISASWATNFTVTPFVLAGIGKPTGGTTSGLATIEDVGIATEFGHLWGGRFNAGGSYGAWQGAGLYSGTRYHGFIGWSHGF